VTGPIIGVGALIVRADGHVLIARRGHPTGCGSWTLPGGKVRKNEKLHDALRREILEETRLSIMVHDLLEVVEIMREGYHYVVLDYLCTPIGGENAQAGDDITAVQWIEPELETMRSLALTSDVLGIVERGLARWAQLSTR